MCSETGGFLFSIALNFLRRLAMGSEYLGGEAVSTRKCSFLFLAVLFLASVCHAQTTTTTISPTSSTVTLGDLVTFTATVTTATGTATGIVTFLDGSTPLGSGTLTMIGVGDSQATFGTELLSAAGSPHSIKAIYQGDATHTASTSSATTETVNPRPSTTAVSLNPSVVGAGQSSTATVTVTDAGSSSPAGTPDAFTSTGSPSPGRTGFTATLFSDGLILVAGGTDANNNVLQSAVIYSSSGGSFTPTTGNLNAARTGAVAVLLPTGKVLIAGGSSNGLATGALNTAELFDPIAGTFTTTSHPMKAARFGATATLLNNGKVLLAGGQNATPTVLNSAELYDPATDTFTNTTGNLNAARTGHSATLLGTGKVLIAGGSSDGTANGALTTAELFDPTAGTFTTIIGANSTLSAQRWQPEAALLLSGKVLIAGGQNSGGALTSADLYDPVTNTFTPSLNSMAQARANGSAIALPNGTVLLAGGTTSQAVDLYDADSDKFDSTGSLQQSDSGLVSTLLNDGDVLVVGLTTSALPASDAELYAPSFNPLGTIGVTSSEPTDNIGAPCQLTPGNNIFSTCTSTITPIQIATSPHTITGTYPADAVHSGNSNTANLTVIPSAPPEILKFFGASGTVLNGNVGLSFTIVNPNPAATLTGISFTDGLPAGLVVSTPNNVFNNCGGTVTAVSGSSSISFTGGTIAPGGPPPMSSFRIQSAQRRPQSLADVAMGQCVITLNVQATAYGTKSNTTGPVSANESGPGNPSNTATLEVIQPPMVAKVFGAASIALNTTTSLTFTFSNPNNVTEFLSLSLNDSLPAGLVVATPNNLTGNCITSDGGSATATAGSGSINTLVSFLLPGSSCSFSVDVTGTTAGAKTNTTANVTGAYFDDISGGSFAITGGTASAGISVIGPPVATKKFSPASVPVNNIKSTLTITLTNPAVNTVALQGVAFTDTFPANLIVATPSGLNNTCNGTATATAGSGVVSLTGGSIPVNSSCAVTVNVTSSVSGTLDSTFVNSTGPVSSTNGGTGAAASATLSAGTNGIAVDSQGNILVAVSGQNEVLIFSSTGAARGQLNPSFLGTFSTPESVSVDSKDNIIVADTGHNRVLIFASVAHGATPVNQITTGNSTAFNQPVSTAVDSQGNLLVADSGNKRVATFALTYSGTGAIAAATSKGQIGPSISFFGQFSLPVAVAVDSKDNILVADNGGNRIVTFSSVALGAAPHLQIGPSIGFLGQFSQLTGLAVNLRDPNTQNRDQILAVDTGNNRIDVFNSIAQGANPRGQIASSPINGQLNGLSGGITTDFSGRICVLDPGNSRVAVFSDTDSFLFSIPITF